jgi:hypothetical protein
MSEVVCTADLRFAGVVQTSVGIHLPVLMCTNVRFVLYSCARRRVPWTQDELERDPACHHFAQHNSASNTSSRIGSSSLVPVSMT